MAVTLAPMLGVALYRTILTAAEKPRVFLKVTLAMLPLNAAADYVLMTGAGPIPAFGPTGSGSGRSSSRRRASRSSFGSAGKAGPVRPSALTGAASPRRCASVCRSASRLWPRSGSSWPATIYAATLGTADVAAHTLALRTAGVAYAVPTALLQAAMVRAARAEALGDPALRRHVVTSGIVCALIAGSLLFAVLAIGRVRCPIAFLTPAPSDWPPQASPLGLLVLLGIMEFVGAPGAVAAGLLRGRKVTRAPMLFALIGHWGIGAPIGLYLCEAMGQGITGLWIGLTAGTLFTSVLTVHCLFARQGPASARTPS